MVTFKIIFLLLSCNAKGEAYYCEVKCVKTYEECLAECNGSDDPTGCRSLCNRDQTTCFDRCPCHDKCFWGCPCGFYQCDPLCQNFQDEGPSKECADICIMQGDDHVGACMGNKPETVCYEEGNKGSFQNFFSDTPRISKSFLFGNFRNKF